jgi:hypothetical protein
MKQTSVVFAVIVCTQSIVKQAVKQTVMKACNGIEKSSAPMEG